MTAVEERSPKKDYRSVPLFADISRAARDFLEGLRNVRYFEQEQVLTDGDPKSKSYGQVVDRWMHTEWVKVRPVAREFGGSGVAEYVIDATRPRIWSG